MSEKNIVKQNSEKDFLEEMIKEREILAIGLAQSRQHKKERSNTVTKKGHSTKKNPVRIF